jgi:hypothetical protein
MQKSVCLVRAIAEQRAPPVCSLESGGQRRSALLRAARARGVCDGECHQISDGPLDAARAAAGADGAVPSRRTAARRF